MASAKDVLLTQLQTGQFLIEKFTADLSDADYFKPPTEGANHAGWLLGHVACSEDSMGAAASGSDKRIPEATHQLFSGSSECVADAGRYPSRKEIDELFKDSRATLVERLKTFDDARWDDPSPEEYPKDFFPTLGSLWTICGTHQFWHIGHLTVCRVALKKPRALS